MSVFVFYEKFDVMKIDVKLSFQHQLLYVSTCSCSCESSLAVRCIGIQLRYRDEADMQTSRQVSGLVQPAEQQSSTNDGLVEDEAVTDLYKSDYAQC